MLNTIYDNGNGFVIKSAGVAATADDLLFITGDEFVNSELEKTEKAALDPAYPALAQVLEYRAALRAYRDNNYDGDRPLLEV